MSGGSCPQCGAKVEEDAVEFCPDCGFYLTWTNQSEPDNKPEFGMMRRPDEETTEPEPSPAPPLHDATTPLGPRCRSCGQSNRPDVAYCEGCGARLLAEPEPALEPGPEPEPARRRRPAPGWLGIGSVVVVVAVVGVVAVLAISSRDGEDERVEPAEEVLDTADVEAVRLPAPPTIDGDLSDWDQVDVAYLSTHQVHPTFEVWDEHDDFRATRRLGWDERFLYVAAEVADDVHVQTQTGDQIWRGDSVDLHLNTALGGPDDLGDAVNEHHFQLILSPGDFVDLPPSAALLRGAPGGATGFGTVDHGRLFDLAARPRTADGGFTLEAAIPWNLIGVQPREGLVLGAALNASDNDRPGEAVQELMVSNAPDHELARPATWGTLTLAPTG